MSLKNGFINYKKFSTSSFDVNLDLHTLYTYSYVSLHITDYIGDVKFPLYLNTSFDYFTSSSQYNSGISEIYYLTRETINNVVHYYIKKNNLIPIELEKVDPNNSDSDLFDIHKNIYLKHLVRSYNGSNEKFYCLVDDDSNRFYYSKDETNNDFSILPTIIETSNGDLLYVKVTGENTLVGYSIGLYDGTGCSDEWKNEHGVYQVQVLYSLNNFNFPAKIRYFKKLGSVYTTFLEFIFTQDLVNNKITILKKTLIDHTESKPYISGEYRYDTYVLDLTTNNLVLESYIGNSTQTTDLKEHIEINRLLNNISISYNDEYVKSSGNYELILKPNTSLVINDISDSQNIKKEFYTFSCNNYLNFPVVQSKTTELGTSYFYEYDTNTLQLKRKSNEMYSKTFPTSDKSLLKNGYFQSNTNNWTFVPNNVIRCDDNSLINNYDFDCFIDQSHFGNAIVVSGGTYFYQLVDIKNLPEEPISINFFAGIYQDNPNLDDVGDVSFTLTYLGGVTETKTKTIHKSCIGNKCFSYYSFSTASPKQILSVRVNISIYSGFVCIFKGISLIRNESLTSFIYEKGVLIKKKFGLETTKYRYDLNLRLLDLFGSSQLKAKRELNTDSYQISKTLNDKGILRTNIYTNLYGDLANWKKNKITQSESYLVDGRQTNNANLTNDVNLISYYLDNYKTKSDITFEGTKTISAYDSKDNKILDTVSYHLGPIQAEIPTIIGKYNTSFSYDNFYNITKYEFKIDITSYPSNIFEYIEFTNFVDKIKTENNLSTYDFYFDYDSNLNVTRIYNGNINFVTFTYDTNKRLTQKYLNETYFDYSYYDDALAGFDVTKSNQVIYNAYFEYYCDIYLSYYEIYATIDNTSYYYETSISYLDNFKNVVVNSLYGSNLYVNELFASDRKYITDLYSLNIKHSNNPADYIYFSSDTIEISKTDLDKFQEYILESGYNFTTFFESSYFTNSADYDAEKRFNIFSLGSATSSNFVGRDYLNDVVCTNVNGRASFIDGKPCGKYQYICYQKPRRSDKYSLSFQFLNAGESLVTVGENNVCRIMFQLDSLTNLYKMYCSILYSGNVYLTTPVTGISIDLTKWNLFYFEYSKTENIFNISINGVNYYSSSNFSSAELVLIKNTLSSDIFMIGYRGNSDCFIRNILYTNDDFLETTVKTSYFDYSLNDIKKDRCELINNKQIYSQKINTFKNYTYLTELTKNSFIPLDFCLLDSNGNNPKYLQLEKNSYLDSVYPYPFIKNEHNIPMYYAKGYILAYNTLGNTTNTILLKFKRLESDTLKHVIFSLGDIGDEKLCVYLLNNSLRISCLSSVIFTGPTISDTNTHTFAFTYKVNTISPTSSISTNYAIEYKLVVDSNSYSNTIGINNTFSNPYIFIGRNCIYSDIPSSSCYPFNGLIGSIQLNSNYLSLSTLQSYANSLGKITSIKNFDVFERNTSLSVYNENESQLINYSYDFDLGEINNYATNKIIGETISFGVSTINNTYSYDNKGNVTSYKGISYSYNDLSQITGNNVQTAAFSYDNYGNMTSSTENGVSLSFSYVTSYGIRNLLKTVYKSLNEYDELSYSSSKPGYPTSIISYNGQFVLNEIHLDYLGSRLLSYTQNFTKTSYVYDKDGVRLMKVTNGNTTYQKFVNDHLFYEKHPNGYEFIYKYDSDNRPVGFTFVNNGTPSQYYFIVNALGIIEQIIDSNGNAVVTYNYGIFGDVLSYTDTSGYSFNIYCSLRYKSYCYDKESGWYYLINRYYIPKWRRFLTPDDLKNIKFDNIDSLNLYAYCGNNPLGASDPKGEYILTYLFFGMIAFCSAFFSASFVCILDLFLGGVSGQKRASINKFLLNFIIGFLSSFASITKGFIKVALYTTIFLISSSSSLLKAIESGDKIDLVQCLLDGLEDVALALLLDKIKIFDSKLPRELLDEKNFSKIMNYFLKSRFTTVFNEFIFNECAATFFEYTISLVIEVSKVNDVLISYCKGWSLI